MSVLLRLTYQPICQGNEKIIYDQLSIPCLSSGSLLKWLHNLVSYSKPTSPLTCQQQQKYSLWTEAVFSPSLTLSKYYIFLYNLCLWFSIIPLTQGLPWVTAGLFWTRALCTPRCMVTETHSTCSDLFRSQCPRASCGAFYTNPTSFVTHIVLS